MLVAGCGGGGGDSGAAAPSGPAPAPVASTSAFPLQVGYQSRVAAGASDSFAISGTCNGTAQIDNGPATVGTFEGVPGFAVTQTATVHFTNCQPSSSTATGANYYDASYTPIGTSVTGVEYSRFATAPTALPASVKVGDSAAYAILTTYMDSTKSIATGQRVFSYLIEADTAATVAVDLVTKTYDSSNRLLLTQQTRYRMVADGTLTLVSIDVQYSATSTVHLLYAKV